MHKIFPLSTPNPGFGTRSLFITLTTGPSRRQIKGSKIAKGLQSATVGDHLMKFFKISLTMPKKTRRARFWDFSNIHSEANYKKIEGALRGFFVKKMPHNAEKKLKGGPFSLARYCMSRGKKEKPFWFSSLGQQLHFDDT